jgi:hypothetical protein
MVTNVSYLLYSLAALSLCRCYKRCVSLRLPANRERIQFNKAVESHCAAAKAFFILKREGAKCHPVASAPTGSLIDWPLERSLALFQPLN